MENLQRTRLNRALGELGSIDEMAAFTGIRGNPQARREYAKYNFIAVEGLNLQRGWRGPFVATSFGGFTKDFADQGAADAVRASDLAQAAAGRAVADDSVAIYVQWAAPDMPAL